MEYRQLHKFAIHPTDQRTRKIYDDVSLVGAGVGGIVLNNINLPYA